MTNNSARAHLVRALRLAPRGVALVLVATLALHSGGGRVHATADREVRLLTIDGVINPFTARYLTRGLGEAAAARAALVVLRLNTPGGLESSTRKMTEAMLSSPVPVVVYVAPAGARAASAGMFITIAAHVAAMAPGTNIGAAHPVGVGGQADTVMTGKVVNDAAALARAIERVVGDPALRDDLRRRGRARVHAFDWETTAEQTVATYEAVAGSGR